MRERGRGSGQLPDLLPLVSIGFLLPVAKRELSSERCSIQATTCACGHGAAQDRLCLRKAQPVSLTSALGCRLL